MPVTVIRTFPLRSAGLSDAAYSTGVENSLSDIPLMIADLNAVGSAYALTTNGTSTTSVLIGTGAKTFTTQLNLGYLVGMTLRIANSSLNFMTGEVTSYATGTGSLVMNITSVGGSGTFASWTISMGAVGDLSTKANLTGATFTGAVAVPNDPYAVGWNGSANVPTKDAVYDKIETLVSLTGGQSIAGNKLFFNDVQINGSGTIGYTTGAGAQVTQLTSKSTGVTLNKSTGTIFVNAAALAANTSVSFTFTNSQIGANDILVVNASDAVQHRITVGLPGAGSVGIVISNVTGGSLSNAITINFALIKGAAS